MAAVFAGLALIAASWTAKADPPAPKVCVVVAGDPDANARATAAHLVDSIAARTDLRGVADDDMRAVLLAETRSDPILAPLVRARRSLVGTDEDAASLDVLGERLGCVLAVEIAPLPAVFLVRTYDTVRRAF